MKTINYDEIKFTTVSLSDDKFINISCSQVPLGNTYVSVSYHHSLIGKVTF